MTIGVAAYGWQAEAWSHFYPEGLPVEWRLDYYANEFYAVVVPFDEWQAKGDAELLEWPQQVADDFRFYWELPTGAAESWERLQRLRCNEAFAAHWGGVVDFDSPKSPSLASASTPPLTLLRLEAALALRPLRQAIEEGMATAEGGVLVVVAPGASANLRSARDLAQLLGGG